LKETASTVAPLITD